MSRPSQKDKIDEAFEYYYTLGAERSHEKVAEKFGVSVAAVNKWSQKYDWQTRKFERDVLIQKAVEERTNDEIIKTRVRYRNNIQAAFGVIGHDLKFLIDLLKAGEKPPWIEDIRDFERFVNCIERLTKLDLLLLGEATEKQETTNKENKTFIDWLMDADRKRNTDG